MESPSFGRISCSHKDVVILTAREALGSIAATYLVLGRTCMGDSRTEQTRLVKLCLPMTKSKAHRPAIYLDPHTAAVLKVELKWESMPIRTPVISTISSMLLRSTSAFPPPLLLVKHINLRLVLLLGAVCLL